MADIHAINDMPVAQWREALTRCCGSTAWVDRMASRQPFPSMSELLSMADREWRQLSRADLLEAFSGHPRIGDLESLRKKFAATADLCSGEQSGVAGADDSVLRELAKCNRQYESRFGFIFIVCATGKSAAEMLAILKERLANEPDDELKIAASEQAKITRLRLEKL